MLWEIQQPSPRKKKRKLNEEQEDAPIVIELWSIVWAFEHWNDYLCDNKFILFFSFEAPNFLPIKTILRVDMPHRFQFILKHKLGIQNWVAHFLSSWQYSYKYTLVKSDCFKVICELYPNDGYIGKKRKQFMEDTF